MHVSYYIYCMYAIHAPPYTHRPSPPLPSSR